MNKRELIGRKFGKLTVIGFDKIIYKTDSKGKNRNQGYWLCKCDCGNEVSISRNVLISNKTKSCGCLIKESAQRRGRKRTIDLTGKKIGKLLVIGLEKTEIKTYSNGTNRTINFWKCKCECGNEVVLPTHILKDGRTKNCEDVKRNATKTYTKIGNEYKKKNILKEGTRLDNLSGKLSRANTSGVRGVSFKKDKNKYKATIGFKKKTYFLGYYDNLEDAKKARERAEEKYYKPILKKYNYIKEDEEELE